MSLFASCSLSQQKRWLILGGVVASVWGSWAFGQAYSQDSDGDGLADIYETFVGLDPQNPADAGMDPDGDTLSNLEESMRATDPYSPDSDQDGLEDQHDDHPVSEGWYDFGNPYYTFGDTYNYLFPPWADLATKEGGVWVQAEPTGWYVPCVKSWGQSTIRIKLNAQHLATDLQMKISLYDDAEGSPLLYVDLLDIDGNTLVSDIGGSLLKGSGESTVIQRTIPMKDYPESAYLQLRREQGSCIYVYWMYLFQDSDLDGLTDSQEKQFGTNPYERDSVEGQELFTTNEAPKVNSPYSSTEREKDLVRSSEEKLAARNAGVRQSLPDRIIQAIINFDQEDEFRTAGDVLPNDDFDGDGFSNYEESEVGSDPVNEDSFPADIRGRVTYSGADSGKVVVLATPSPDSWDGYTVSELNGSGVFRIADRPTLCNYWIKAFLDVNGNGKPDACEPRGQFSDYAFLLQNDLMGADFEINDDETPPVFKKAPKDKTVRSTHIPSVLVEQVVAEDDTDAHPAIRYEENVRIKLTGVQKYVSANPDAPSVVKASGFLSDVATYGTVGVDGFDGRNNGLSLALMGGSGGVEYEMQVGAGSMRVYESAVRIVGSCEISFNVPVAHAGINIRSISTASGGGSIDLKAYNSAGQLLQSIPVLESNPDYLGGSMMFAGFVSDAEEIALITIGAGSGGGNEFELDDLRFGTASLPTQHIERVWTATDQCGNSSSYTQVIRVAENILPPDPRDIEIEVPAGEVWINEIHYNNVRRDVNEGVELAGHAGIDLSQYSLALYDGESGKVYHTEKLRGVIPNQIMNMGAVFFSLPAIKNGPDGMALVSEQDGVVDILAYGGNFTAVNGPASGMTLTDIVEVESDLKPVGNSLQLIGTGCTRADFVWIDPTNSFGSFNEDQIITVVDANGPIAPDVPPRMTNINIFHCQMGPTSTAIYLSGPSDSTSNNYLTAKGYMFSYDQLESGGVPFFGLSNVWKQASEEFLFDGSSSITIGGSNLYTNCIRYVDFGQYGRGSRPDSQHRIYAFGQSDIDSDSDGIPDGMETFIFNSDPTTAADSDSDGLPDEWEIYYGLDPYDDGTTNAANGMSGDPDGDGLPNSNEFIYLSSPITNDTDGDLMPDGWEHDLGLNPNSPSDARGDLDGDDMWNQAEYVYGLNPTNSADAVEDADGDCFLNVYEVYHYSNPTNAESTPNPTAIVTNGGDVTIQAAITASTNDYDLIAITPGTYMGVSNKEINLEGKVITVFAAGAPGSVVIDCEGSGRGFDIRGGETAAASIIGIKVINGSALFGAGMSISEGSDVSVCNCTFEDNVAKAVGGGVYIFESSDPSFTKCHIAGNTATNGGGIGVYASSPMFWSCIIQSNQQVGTNFTGAGVVAIDGAAPHFENCLFSHNAADSFGGGISAADGTYSVKNGNLLENTAGPTIVGSNSVCWHGVSSYTYIGPGSYSYTETKECHGYGVLTLTNGYIDYPNTTVWGPGGAAFSYGNASFITNSIIWGNDTDQLATAGGGQVKVRYSIVEGGYSGTGNITSYPSLRISDYHLLSNSPAINAGTSDGAPLRDYDGEYRNDTNGVDIGYDEFVDTDSDGIGDYWELAYIGHLDSGATNDYDGDGISNISEYEQGGFPNSIDSDGDGLFDDYETLYSGTDPYNADSDGDGMPDGFEVQNSLDPNSDDSGSDLDGDGLTNLLEYELGTLVGSDDSDSDNLTDFEEVYGTQWGIPSNPINSDTDGDGLNDGLDEFVNSPTGDQDGDGIPDASDSDYDNDGVANGSDAYPWDPDGDGDGVPDGEDYDPTDPLVWTSGSDTNGPSIEIVEPEDGAVL